MDLDPWLLWLIATVVLGVLEAVTPVLIFGMLGIAALVGVLLALLGVPVAFQILGFVVASIATLGFVRPIARKYMRPKLAERSGIERLVGQDAEVIQRVDARGGQVKLAGELWSARAFDPTLVLEPGSTVQVIEIEGATALVYGSGSGELT
ncbi:MAG: NfeD family protein [Streptosporangiales bacterium]